MPAPSRTIVAFPAQTLTATGSPFLSSKIVSVENYTSFISTLSVGTVSGTSPTLDVFIQQGMRPAAGTETALQDAQGSDANIVWDDYAHFAQITLSNQVKVIRAVGGGNASSVAQDAQIAAGTIVSGPLGSIWRIKLVVAGTNPSFAAVKVLVNFIP